MGRTPGCHVATKPLRMRAVVDLIEAAKVDLTYPAAEAVADASDTGRGGVHRDLAD